MSLELKEQKGVRLAIEGCAHGELNTIYASVAEACKQKGWPEVDLLIIGGDFQSVRNAFDLNCVSMPAKYRRMCDFHEYYAGQRTAPYLTVFVGGNHEASNYLFELYYGGWVAPNIYYLGAANVLRFGPLRIASMSGIWKGYDYRKPHRERLPYDEDDLKSIYHTRELDVRKLLQIRTQVDIGISHDWPQGVEWQGDHRRLFRYKGHLEQDARDHRLGNTAAKYALDHLRPRIWISAHLHVKYAAEVRHDSSEDAAAAANGHANGAEAAEVLKGNDAFVKNSDEIDIDMDEDGHDVPTNVVAPINADEVDLELESEDDGLASVAPGQGLDGVKLPVQTSNGDEEPLVGIDEARAALPDTFNRPEKTFEKVEHPPDIINKTTKFLALDKPLPNHHFLQLLELPVDASVERPRKLTYDREWLAVTRSFALDEPLEVGNRHAHMPGGAKRSYAEDIDKRRLWIDEKFSEEDLIVPENFEVTAPVYDGGDFRLPQYAAVTEYPNPQTASFCQMLDIPNPFEMSEEQLSKAEAVRQNSEVTVPWNEAQWQQSSHGGNRGGGSRGRGGRGNHRGGGRGRGRGRGNQRSFQAG